MKKRNRTAQQITARTDRPPTYTAFVGEDGAISDDRSPKSRASIVSKPAMERGRNGGIRRAAERLLPWAALGLFVVAMWALAGALALAVLK